MTAGLALPASTLSQTLERVPLTPWSIAGFLFVISASLYLGARRSPLVLLALAFSVPFAGYRDVAQTTLTIPKCVAFGSALGLVLSGLDPRPRSLPARLLLVMGALLLVPIAASAAHAQDLGLVGREFFKQAEYLVFFWCAAIAVENIRGASRYLVWGVAAATFFVATLALVQAFSGNAPSAVLVNGYAVPRVASTLEGPNQLAGFLEAALPILWTSSFGGFALASYDAGASWAALILSGSRAGALMSAISYGLLFRLSRAAAMRWIAVSVCGVALGFATLGYWFAFRAHASWSDIERFLLLDVNAQAGGVGTRAQLWPAALALFRRDPLLGIGAGNFPLQLPSVGIFGVATGASSLWLQTLAEEGIVGIVALAAFVWMAVRETYRLRASSVLAVAAFLATVNLYAHQIVDNLFFFPKVAELYWLLLGAAAATACTAGSAGQGSTSQ